MSRPQFGPIVVVGGGGILVELYKDVAVRLAPITEATAREMIRQTRAATLLAGWRGRPAGDFTAAAQTVALLSRFVTDFRDAVTEVEIDPLAVLHEGEGVKALDCLIVPRLPCPTRLWTAVIWGYTFMISLLSKLAGIHRGDGAFCGEIGRV